jgi:uncharacterized membrane protein
MARVRLIITVLVIVGLVMLISGVSEWIGWEHVIAGIFVLTLLIGMIRSERSSTRKDYGMDKK